MSDGRDNPPKTYRFRAAEARKEKILKLAQVPLDTRAIATRCGCSMSFVQEVLREHRRQQA